MSETTNTTGERIAGEKLGPATNERLWPAEVAKAIRLVQGLDHWQILGEHRRKWTANRLVSWIKAGCPMAAK